MIGQTIGHYRVLDQIGGGGMGVVYRAEDQRLGRPVALKLLPPDLGESSEARERFRREAELISSLNHPHICTLHDVGEHEGRRFLVFELVDGRTLKQAIGGTPLPVERAVEVAVDIADALDAAHGRGIMHRDVKPGNIMLTSRGDAKLLDFGIAKREWRPATESEATRADVTRHGEWVGTPDYMAPEQARGEVMDARADLFALGAVMYEMVTGRPPFRADTVAGTIAAVLRRTPERPSALNPQVPEALERVILKALEKDRALRYQTAREIVADLRRLSRDATPSDAASTAEARPRPRRPVTIAVGAGVGLVAAVIGWLLLSGRPADTAPPGPSAVGGPARLVVLPFENQTGQAADDWLAGAFADAVNAALQPVSSLILVPRERVVELYAAESRRESQAISSELARQISKKLRVRYYVHGSYQRVGDDVRVSARLVDVESDALGPQETLTDRHANVLALEDRLAARFAAKLGSSEPSTRVGSTSDLAARQWVTEARSLYARGSVAEARPLLEQAVAKDARFAEAWALLSKTYSRLAAPAMAGSDGALTSMQPALEAAKKAADLAPDLADSHIALALAYRGLQQRDRMRVAAERAAALAPRQGEPLILLADLSSISPGYGCPVDGQPAVAEKGYREGLHLDPDYTVGYGNLATLLWWMDKPAEAAQANDQGLAAQPANATLKTWRPFNLAFAGRLDEAEILLKDSADSSATSDQAVFIRGMVALKSGRVAEADGLLRRVDGLLQKSLALTLITSVAQFQSNRPAEGARYLARSVLASPECRQWALQVPALAPYRELPEFKKAIR